MSEETVTFNLELNVEQTLSEIRRLESLLYRTLSLARRIGLPEDISEAVYKLQRLIMTIRLAHTAMIALQAAAGPIGWASAAVGIVSAVVSATEVLEVIGR